MRAPISAAFVTFLACSAACTDDPPTGARPLGGELVGTWRAFFDAGSPPSAPGDRFTYRFAADGSVTVGAFDDPAPATGTYAIDGDYVVLTMPTSTGSMPYYRVTDDRLLIRALAPTRAVDGVIGDWAGMTAEVDGMPLGVAIRGDGTATVSGYEGAFPGEVYEATWTAFGPEVQIEAPGRFPLQVIVLDSVLGMGYERVP